MAIDSYRFLDFITRQVIKAWVERESTQPSPWTPLEKPLSEHKVALVSTAGIARNDDRPFDQEGERQNPWWGDPTHRTIPRGTTERQVKLYHLHIDTRFGEQDLDVVLPLRRLEELARAGVVKESAPTHYSLMGYLLDPRELVDVTAPRLLESMKAEGVDSAVLIPA